MNEQKKQNLLTIVIIMLVITLIMMIGSIVYEEVNMSKKAPVQSTSSPVQGEEEKNDTIENGKTPVEEKKEENIPQQDDKNYIGEEEGNNGENSTQSKDEKAIDLVKKEWGSDDSVTFSIEQKNGTKYYVAVKKENEPTIWYEVDTENWKVSEY